MFEHQFNILSKLVDCYNTTYCSLPWAHRVFQLSPVEDLMEYTRVLELTWCKLQELSLHSIVMIIKFIGAFMVVFI